MAILAVLPFWPALIMNGVSGVFNLLFFVPAMTIVQERAPELRARARHQFPRRADGSCPGLLVRGGHRPGVVLRRARGDGRAGTAAHRGHDRRLSGYRP